MTLRRAFFILGILLLIGAVGITVYRSFFEPTVSKIPAKEITEDDAAKITIIATELDTPWALAKLPGGRLLVSEREGTLRIIGTNSQSIKVADVVETSEGGLLGLTLHPLFASNNQVYIYKTIGPTNVVERYVLKDNKLLNRTAILEDIPAADNHNGGELEFGPDGKLYVTTGDAGTQAAAQDTRSLAGKILRINDDGSNPTDNPFGNMVWSYGHRNPQGLAWDKDGRLWSTEHGPSGLNSGYDELNRIEKGGNYGWPVVKGAETKTGMIAPVVQSGGNETWAPAGLAYSDDALYFTGLRAQTLYKGTITGDTVKLGRYLPELYGRLRGVIVDGNSLLLTTSNRDGRGTPRDGDDKIIRVPFSLVK